MNFTKKYIKYLPLLISIIFLILFLTLPYSFVTICSGSMSKTLNVGDVMLYKKIDKNYKLYEGDIIVFKKYYKPAKKNIKLIHRIKEVYMYKDDIWGYHTKGDASDSIDQFAVYPEEIIGIYVGKIKYIGYPVTILQKIIGKFDGTEKLSNYK